MARGESAMGFPRGRVVLAAVILLVGARTSAAGEYSDPDGFSVVYPEGWFALSKTEVGAMRENLPPGIKSWVEKSKIDFKTINLILVREGDEDEPFLENMNVAVRPGQLSLDPASVKAILPKLRQEYKSLGATIEGLEGHVEKLGANEALVVSFKSRFPVLDFPLRQRQVFIPGGGKTFTLTCTGPADTFAKYAPVFETILASLKVPAPIAKGFQWSGVWGGALNGGVIGGIAGAVGVLILKLSGKLKLAKDV
jgi:hypothetical protein